jgi:hypothetical protein
MKPLTNCPYCAEPVEPGVTKCRSCGESLEKKPELAPMRVGSGDVFDPTDAIKWPFDDPDWVKKTLLGALFWFLGAFSILFLFIPLFIFLGYQVRIARQQRDHPGRRPMPEWDDFGTLIKDGFLLFIAVLLPPLLVGMVVALIIGVVVAAAVASTGGGRGGGGPPPVLILGVIGLELGGIVLALLYSYLLPAILMEYLETGSAAASFRVGEIWRRVTTVDYLILFVCDMAVGMLGGMGVLLCYVGAFITVPLSMYVRSALAGRFLAREHNRLHGLTTT